MGHTGKNLHFWGCSSSAGLVAIPSATNKTNHERLNRPEPPQLIHQQLLGGFLKTKFVLVSLFGWSVVKITEENLPGVAKFQPSFHRVQLGWVVLVPFPTFWILNIPRVGK